MSELQKEILQSRPFSSREEEVFLNLQRTAYALRLQLDEILKAYGLTGTQYNVLRILRGAGGDGLPCSEIGDRMVTNDPDITRLLERLQKAGLISKQRAEEDKRVVVTKITDEGLKLLEDLDTPIRDNNVRSLGHLGPEMLEQLNALLVLARRPNK